MSDEHPMFELLIWNPQSPNNTSKVLDWLRTQPGKDIVGYIQIGQQKPHQITHRNRHTWEKILFDFVSQDQQIAALTELVQLTEEYGGYDDESKSDECPRGTHESLDDALGCWKCQNASLRSRGIKNESR